MRQATTGGWFGKRAIRPFAPVLLVARPFLLMLLLSAILAAGCSSGNNSSGLNLITPQGNHPAGFVSTHSALILSSSDTSLCEPCHGDTLEGGIAKVSCFSASRSGVACHHPSPASWAARAQHGAAAKKAPGQGSFIVCRICHGSDFAGGGSGVSCLNGAGCHGAGINSPHPRRPWHAGGTDNTHTNTDTANAVVCVSCHANGANTNPSHPPPTPAPAGTPPGCFNSTMCHGAEAAPHILGATWRNATSSAFHGLTAKADLVYCQGCHGTVGTILFDGGAAPTKCSTCHTAAKAHPTTWYNAPVATFPGYVASHRNSSNQSASCGICHDYTQGRTAPNSSAPSCFSASYSNAEHGSVGCHSGGPGVNHAVPYFDNTHFQATTTTFSGNCSNCHAVTGTSPSASAPLCTVCHTAGSPFTLTNCTSCHANPPTGSAYPDIAGAHAVHIALNGAGTPVTCSTCHSGLGTNTLNHYNRANGRTGAGGRVPPGDASFVATYNAKTGSASFNSTAFTCSNVSCHGGQSAPNWRTGTLNVDTQCTSCHASGTTQFNSYNSGEHGRSQHVSAGCTACHNTSKLADPAVGKHFLALGTTALDVRGSVTIGGGATKVVTYTPGGTVGTGSCTPQSGVGCHGSENW